MSRQRRNRPRPQIIAPPQMAAQVAVLRRHPTQHRPGTGRRGLIREFLRQEFCLTCFKPVGLALTFYGPHRDVWQIGRQDKVEDSLPPAYWFEWDWAWAWAGEHAKHRVVNLHLRGVRRIGSHIDPDDYWVRLHNAARLAMLQLAADQDRRWEQEIREVS